MNRMRIPVINRTAAVSGIGWHHKRKPMGRRPAAQISNIVPGRCRDRVAQITIRGGIVHVKLHPELRTGAVRIAYPPLKGGAIDAVKRTFYLTGRRNANHILANLPGRAS
jgi:hypothetical protein